MATKLRSLLVTGPVTVPLSSGATVRLSPGEVSEELPDAEVANNSRIEGLRQRGVIEVETTESEQEKAESEKPGPEKKERKSPARPE